MYGKINWSGQDHWCQITDYYWQCRRKWFWLLIKNLIKWEAGIVGQHGGCKTDVGPGSPVYLMVLNATIAPWQLHDICLNEPRHDKTNKMSVCPAKTQISLGIRLVWSESSLSTWRKLGSLATHWAIKSKGTQKVFAPYISPTVPPPSSSGYKMTVAYM